MYVCVCVCVCVCLIPVESQGVQEGGQSLHDEQDANGQHYMAGVRVQGGGNGT